MSIENYVVYPAVFDDSENEKGEYTITFPDVLGAISQADSINEAVHNAWEALGLMLYDQKDLPKASTLEKVQKDNPKAIVQLIGVDLSEYAKGVTKTVAKVKKNTTIPADLAKEAERLGINFSLVLTKALEEEVKHKNRI